MKKIRNTNFYILIFIIIVIVISILIFANSFKKVNNLSNLKFSPEESGIYSSSNPKKNSKDICNSEKYHLDFNNIIKSSFPTYSYTYPYARGDFTALIFIPGVEIPYSKINILDTRVFSNAIISSPVDVYINDNICKVYASENLTLINLCPQYFKDGPNILRYVINSTYGINITRLIISLELEPGNC